MKINNKKGISLIVLVITIIVIIILAGAIILSLSNNNPISQAVKATYLSDVRNFQNELNLYKTKQFAETNGNYELAKLQADETSVTYNGVIDNTKTIKDIITSIGISGKYNGKFKIVNGELVFQGTDTNEQNWASEIGIQVISQEPYVGVSVPDNQLIKPGTDIVYTITFTSNVAITNVNLTGKVNVIDNLGVNLPVQPNIVIGTLSGTNSDIIRQVDVTIKTTTLTDGTYKLKINPGSITNSNNISDTKTITSLVGFDVDNQAPVNPTMSSNPSSWTNASVSVTITYSSDSNVKEYSLDGTTWLNYTVPVIVSTNNTTVYARGKDSVGNVSGLATMTVSNIDKTLPTVDYATNGGSAASQVSTAVTASDAGGSLLNATSLQYIWSNQNTVAPSSGWTSFTSGATLTKAGTAGTYYLWIKASDNAGNIQTTVSNSFVILQNFATGSTPIVSASYPTSPAINAIDGNLTTQWNSGTTTGWYTLDLLSSKTLSYINISTDASSVSVTYSVYGSNNNSTWTLLATSSTPPKVWQKVNITGSYRYVKINADNWNSSWVAIQELEVY